jgi:hypothetical protein
MARPRLYTNEEMIAALQETKGLVFLAARKLGCERRTIYRRAESSKAVAAVIAQQRGEMVDTAELSLYNAILGGEAWAVQFVLKTLGKDRGYVESTEHLLRGEVRQEIVVEIVESPGYRGASTNGYLPAQGETHE